MSKGIWFCFGFFLTKKDDDEDDDAQNWYIRYIKSKDEKLLDSKLKLIAGQKDSWQY